jgi:eukaryotic-like serine/threonine-protein kinase
VSVPTRIGRYRILGLLGQGAMGTVYRGRDDALEREVAVKVMALGPADADARARFLREARAAARLQHSNIVTIYELGDHEGSPFMALELLEGTDLQRAIEAGIRPDVRVTLQIVLQVLGGLGHAHENGIVHRDVKPSNVFLARGRPAKIMDFGVARLAGGASTAGLVVGTPNYMSPEQVRAGAIDGRSDLFSVGLILYELVTGEKAFRGDTVIALLYKIVNEEPDLTLIPRGAQWETLRRVLARSLAKKPDDRYPDARAMAADLGAALRELGGSPEGMAASDQALMVRTRGGSPVGSEALAKGPAGPPPAGPPPAVPPPTAAPPESSPGRSADAVRRSRAPLAIAAVLGVGAIALLAVAVLLLMRPRDQPVAPARPVVSPPTLPPPTAPSPTTVPSTPAPSSSSPASTTAPAPETLPSGPAPENARMDRANDSMEKGRYAQALAEAKAILARDPNNAEARALAGDAEAAILIEECVKRARAALKAGDVDRALEEIKKGLLVNPNEGRLLALHREATQ